MSIPETIWEGEEEEDNEDDEVSIDSKNKQKYQSFSSFAKFSKAKAKLRILIIPPQDFARAIHTLRLSIGTHRSKTMRKVSNCSLFPKS